MSDRKIPTPIVLDICPTTQEPCGALTLYNAVRNKMIAENQALYGDGMANVRDQATQICTARLCGFVATEAALNLASQAVANAQSKAQ